METALLWNVSLTALLALALTGLSRLSWLRRRPALIHLLWLLVLAKLVTPPLLFPAVLPAATERGKTIATAVSASATWRNTVSAKPEFPSSVAEVEVASLEPAASVPKPALPPLASDESLSGVPARPASSSGVLPDGRLAGSVAAAGSKAAFHRGELVAVSLLGTCLLAAFYAIHAVKLDRWLRRARSDDVRLSACCAELAAGMGIRGRVLSGVVEARTTPLLWAWRQPVVIAPRQLVAELDATGLRGIVAHELAHLARRDHWANAFVGVVKALFWWNPVVWWADRQMRAAQELCCDAMAMECCRANRGLLCRHTSEGIGFCPNEAAGIVPDGLAVGFEGYPFKEIRDDR